MSRRRERDRVELVQLLAEQRAALAASCENYDRGNEWEAARLATTIFTLLHDGGSVTSILTQLGLRSKLKFISSGKEYDRQNLAIHTPLVAVRLQGTPNGPEARTVPLLNGPMNSSTRYNQFPTWWEKEPIYDDRRASLTRRRLVFALRHQDGGGHVGVLTDEAYVRMKTKAVFYAVVGSQPEQPLYVMTASMRQIGWEVTEALKELGEVT